METRKTKLALTASALAFALMLAGCGGGGSSSTAVTPSGGGGAPPPTENEPEETLPPAPTNVVELPAEHGITKDVFDLDPEGFNKKDTFLAVNDDGEFTIMPGMSAKLGGVRFYCPDGDNDCTLTLSFMDDGMLDMVQYDEDGGMPTAAALKDRGWQAFKDLDEVLVDNTRMNGMLSPLEDLRVNRYHGARGGPNGLTSSHTSHDDQTCADCAVRGVSDIRVTVTPDRTEAPGADREVDKIGVGPGGTGAAPVADPNPGTSPWEIMDAVLADGNDGEASFNIAATWGLNTAATWEAEYTENQGNRRPSLERHQVWRYVFDAPMTGKVDLPGRTVDVDLRTDYDPNSMVLNTMNDGTGGPANHPGGRNGALPSAVPDEEGNPNAVRAWPQGGPGTRIVSGPTDNRNTIVEVSWEDVTFDDEEQVSFRGEIDLEPDNPHTQRTVEGLTGSYQGVRGIFVCEDADGDGDCQIRHQREGMMGASNNDFIRFVPYESAEDMDWLAAGVWLTIPDQLQADGYAIGAYVWGANPWEPTSAQDARNIPGTATYTGEAFGRFAEMVGDEMETGRFEATASLMANFDIPPPHDPRPQ